MKVRVYAFLILSSEVTPLTLNDLTFSDDVIHIEQKVQIDVSDQGIGIPPHEHEKIFEAFRQVGRKNAGRRPGAGLAICKSIIEAHHERIWIQDSAVGTTVSFTLGAV